MPVSVRKVFCKNFPEKKVFLQSVNRHWRFCHMKTEARNKYSEAKKQITIIPTKAFFFSMFFNILVSCFLVSEPYRKLIFDLLPGDSHLDCYRTLTKSRY